MEEELNLIRAARRGDPEAFAELYKEFYQNMYHFALYTLRNMADAEDVVSEAVVSAFSSIHRLRSEGSFKNWMFRIVSNKCMEKLRSYAKKTEELDEDFGVPFMSTEKEGLEEEVAVRQAFFELADDERLIIGMHLFCGYTSKEIAGILHMNENTVRSKESRGLKKMARKLEDVPCKKGGEYDRAGNNGKDQEISGE